MSEPELLLMSQRERDRMKVLHEVAKGRLRQQQASAQLGLMDRVERKLLRRPRRVCRAELVQWDTSGPSWLEGRGEDLYLIGMIDDATSRLQARLVRRRSFASARRYGEHHPRFPGSLD